MPPNGAARTTIDEPAQSVLHRADAHSSGARGSARQRFATPEPYADVIEVEFETVPPISVEPDLASSVAETPRPAANGRGHAPAKGDEPLQPPPPDIEAIAAALAAEMDRNAARNVRQPAEAPREEIVAPVEEPVAPAIFASIPEREPIAATVPQTAAPAPLDMSIQETIVRAERRERRPAAPLLENVLPQEAIAPAESLVQKAPAEEAPAQSNASHFARVTAQIAPIGRQVAHFARVKAAPAAIKIGFWIAHNLRRKEIRRRYGKAVSLVHSRVLDRRLEQHFFVPTLKAQRFSPDPERGILYEGPVPAAAFNWALSVLPEDLREYAFVDFRAGLGRAMLLASQRKFERILGYEYAAAPYDDLQMNIAQFPRSKMACRDIQCFRGDRAGVSIPDQPCVLYFANSWREEFLNGITTYLGESYRHRPRRLYVILENVDERVGLPHGDIFYRLELPLAEKLKLRLLSPMDFQVYRTLV